MDATTVRRRPAGDKPSSKKPQREADSDYEEDTDAAPARWFSVLDVVRVLLGLLLLSSAMSWFVHGDSLLWGWKPWWANVNAVRGWMASILPAPSDTPLTANRKAPSC
jgi:hypothetical protein